MFINISLFLCDTMILDDESDQQTDVEIFLENALPHFILGKNSPF